MKKQRFKMLLVTVLFAALCSLCFSLVACGEPQSPSGYEGGGIVIASGQTKADILVSSSEFPQVARAASDLKNDVAMVSGVEPEVRETPSRGTAIVIGTLGRGGHVDRLVQSGKLDEAKTIAGTWERYVLKTVKDPFEGVDRAIVVAGSDMRGTVYGIYTLSEMIGVSPWYWFADVEPDKKEVLALDVRTTVSGSPSVKYRGIFINDEFNFSTWAKGYSSGDGAPNYEVYSRVFELLLRLKANCLWPGMHGVSTAFYKVKDADGVSINAKYADKYGVLIGTSHCEQMLRNNVGEWGDWVRENSGKYGLGYTANLYQYSQTAYYYDYSLYPEAVAAYWRERIEETRGFESLITIGMRGVHDEGFSYAGLADKSFPNRVALLQSVIDKQLEIIEDVYGENYADEVQLVYIPYKEAADYYYGRENGVDYNVKVRIPDDAILMWAEDNYGYLRQSPDAEDVTFDKDGYSNVGTYYHISYVGVPCVYIWTDLTSYGTVYEQMRRAYDTGINGNWIVNVGDIKPGEYGAEYFLTLAYDIDRYDDRGYVNYMRHIAERDYTTDPELAGEIAKLVVEFKNVAETYKADFAGKDNMAALSAIDNGDEAMRLLNTLEGFYDRANSVYDRLPESKKAAFYQTVLYAVRGEYFAVKRIVYAKRSSLYYRQGRYAASANYAQGALEAQDMLEADVVYYNCGLSDGKWYGLMNEHIGDAYYGLVTREELEEMITFGSAVFGERGVGAVCEGQKVYEPGGELRFTSLGREQRFIDVYSLGSTAEKYTVDKPQAVKLEYSGIAGAEERLTVSIDGAAESFRGEIRIADEFGNEYVFTVAYETVDAPQEENAHYIIDGAASIEAEKPSRTVRGADGTEWAVAGGAGRSGSSLRVYPDSYAKKSVGSTGAKAVYRVWAPAAGRYTAVLYRIPSLNENGSCDLAIGVGEGAPVAIRGTKATNTGNWSAMVMQRIEKLSAEIELRAGFNDVCLYRVDPYIAIDKIVILSSGTTDPTYYGASETYNTFGGYSPLPPAALPTWGELEEPQPYERRTDNFNFGYREDPTSVHIDVVDTVYSEARGFGFRVESGRPNVEGVLRTGFVGAERNRSYVRGAADTEFVVDIENGAYSIAYAVGDMWANGDYFDMSLSVNGIAVLESAHIDAGGTGEWFAVVEVTDGKIVTSLSGKWCLNAMEIYPYNVYAAGGSGMFVVDGEGGYIEAEAALENSAEAYIRDAVYNERAWTETAGVSGSAMIAGPDSGKNNTNTATLTGASMHYKVRFEEGGTYYVWALIKTLSADDDSYHIAWDNAYALSYNPSKRLSGFHWEYSRYTVNVSAGSVHTFSVWQREDGIVIDKFYFSPYSSSNSGGFSVSEKMPLFEGVQKRERA